jgi:hypothetical protein
MKFVNVDVDAQGHSYFKQIELPQTGVPHRISSKSQDVLYWLMTLSQPGHVVDFTPSPDLRVLAVFSGQMNVTVSNGETRQFVRGDMLTLWDTSGQGHRIEIVGLEPCHVLHMAIADKGTFSG